MTMLNEIISAIARWIHGTKTPESVAKALDDIAAKRAERLYWRTSIVDLLKLIDMDSSLAARRKLASEVGYVGMFNGTAQDNVWLHGEIMKAIGQGDIKL